ncbi:MAG: NlpC/P60 family protein [Christensenellales bacterium]
MFFYSGNSDQTGHAGIYGGDGSMFYASSSYGKIVENNINTNYWKIHFAFTRRVA